MKTLSLSFLILSTLLASGRPHYEFVSVANSVGNVMNTFQIPAINADGKLVFRVLMPGVGEAVCTGDGSAPAVILASPADGMTPAGLPVVNGSHAAFRGSVGGLDPFIYAVPLNGGAINTIYQHLPANGDYASFDPILTVDGTIYFTIEDSYSNVANPHFAKLLRSSVAGGTPTTVVDATATYLVGEPLGVSPATGKLYFIANPPSPTTYRVVHSTPLSAFGGPGSHFFDPRTFNGSISVNTSGTLAFSQSLSSSSGTSSRIVRVSPSAVASTVADSTKFNISQFGTPAINASGAMVFSGLVYKAGVFRYNVYRGGNPVLDKLFGTDTPLFGSKIVTVETSRFAINDQGQIAFKYLLANGVSGVAVAKPVALPAPPIPAVVATVGQPVTGESPAMMYSSFGVPQVSVFSGQHKTGKVLTTALFGADGSAKLRTGTSGTSLLGTTLAAVGAPSGDAVVATLKTVPGSLTTANNVVLLRDLATGAPTVVARTGTPIPGLPSGVTIKTFGAIDGQGSTLFFMATLKGTGIVVGKDVALCAALTNGNVNVLVKKGDIVLGKTVSSLTTLASSTGTAAEGRWRMGNDHFGVLLGFPAANQAMYRIPGTSTGPADWTSLIETGVIADGGGVLNGKRINKINLAAFGPNSAAALVTIATEAGVVTKTNDTAIVSRNIGASYVTLAREGSTLLTDADNNPQVGVTISSLSKVVVGGNGSVAFVIGASNASVGTALAYSATGATWRLLANTGSPAPVGSSWSTFPSLVLPDGAGVGPIFTATLKPNTAESITTANSTGVWTLAADGTLRRLFTTGQEVAVGMTTKSIRSIMTLAPAAGSSGAASTHASTGTVSAVVQFTDGNKSLLRASLP